MREQKARLSATTLARTTPSPPTPPFETPQTVPLPASRARLQASKHPIRRAPTRAAPRDVTNPET